MARRYSHHRHSSPSMLSLETQMSRCHQCCRYGFGHFHYCIVAVHGSHDRHLFLWLQEELEIGLSSVMSLFISIWLCFIYNPLLHIAFLLQERPQNHLDMHHRLDSKGQHQGKLINYRYMYMLVPSSTLTPLFIMRIFFWFDWCKIMKSNRKILCSLQLDSVRWKCTRNCWLEN